MRQGHPQTWHPRPIKQPPLPLAQRPRGLTHQFRPHCSGQTPCTSLEITEQKLALEGPQCLPWGVTGWVFRGPTPAPSPHVGGSMQVLSFQLLSLEKGLTPAAPFDSRRGGARCQGPTLTLCQDGQLLSPRPPAVRAGRIPTICEHTEINARPWGADLQNLGSRSWG